MTSSSRPVSVWLASLAAVLPLLGFLGSIARAELELAGDVPVIELAIEGYDPRDPVRGRYVRYRFFAESTERTQGAVTRACVLPTGAGRHRLILYSESATHLSEEREPGAPSRRWVVIPPGETPWIHCDREFSVEFATASHRFYIQEDQAVRIEKATLEGRASVRVALVSRERIVVRALLIDGTPVATP